MAAHPLRAKGAREDSGGAQCGAVGRPAPQPESAARRDLKAAVDILLDANPQMEGELAGFCEALEQTGGAVFSAAGDIRAALSALGRLQALAARDR